MRRNLSFKSVTLYTLGTGWYNYGLSLKSRRIWIPRGLVSPSMATGVDRSPRRTLEGGPRVLVLYQESGLAVFQAFCGTIPENSQLGAVGSTNSLEGSRRGPGGLVLHQTRAEKWS